MPSECVGQLGLDSETLAVSEEGHVDQARDYWAVVKYKTEVRCFAASAGADGELESLFD